MNKTLTTTIASLVALGSVAGAIPAQAQDRWRDSDRNGVPDRSDRNHDRDHHGRRDQWDRHDQAHREWRDNRGNRWRYYGSSYGYDGYRGNWRTGQRYPYWRDNRYVISNYGYYGLPAPRPGYRYYRDRNGDIVMVAIASGIIGLIVGSAIAR
ncbi:MAG: RcnB family protein [Sphingomonadales bacterium]|nr:RcnB family protein [Sphingomonadales bacterium]